MKIATSFLLCIGLIVLFNSICNSQSKLRKLDDTKNQYPNQPIAITNRDVGSQKVRDDGTVTAGSDWIKSLTFTVKNISNKTLNFFEIDLIVDENERNPYRVVFPIRFGVPIWIDASGNVKVSDRSRLLRPNESVVVGVTEHEAKVFYDLLKRYGADDFDSIVVQVLDVEFDDDTGWTLGREWRRDPANRNKLLPRVVTKPEHQSLWRNVTDFFFVSPVSQSGMNHG